MRIVSQCCEQAGECTMVPLSSQKGNPRPMKLPKSRVGWVFVAIYLVMASVLVYQAFTCTGWVCDLVEFPATIPFGLLILRC
jgi:hypothetical protein